jgi:transcriptional regulator with XRE-family HTH domain
MGRSTYMDPRFLLQAMHEHGWTQKELAVKARVSETAVSRAVRGIPITYPSAERITRALLNYRPLPESHQRVLKRVG